MVQILRELLLNKIRFYSDLQHSSIHFTNIKFSWHLENAIIALGYKITQVLKNIYSNKIGF